MKTSSRYLFVALILPGILLFAGSESDIGTGSSPINSEPPLAGVPWAATDGLGRELPGFETCGPLHKDKFVGLFYFLWLGAHEQRGPHDISILLEASPDEPEWGEEKIFHWWGEPRFGYYVMDDEWVIAKHAQLLADAGVDVIVFDVTNRYTYPKHYLKICQVFTEIRSKGGDTPQISFLFNSKHVEATQEVYEDFYKQGLYQDLWFQWKGKPLLMTNPEGQSHEVLDFFTLRRSWAWPNPKNWFGDGQDKWPWIAYTPQSYGWHESPEIPEQMAVAAASHPINRIGRSHSKGQQPPVEEQNALVGTYFQEQWDHALEIDPEFIFITGWNEWVAQRFIYEGQQERPFADGTIQPGDTWFIDQYSMEFSRDTEPMRGGFEDNYYYQLVANIRKFKGGTPFPVSKQSWPIRVDGSSEDWKPVTPELKDDSGDTRHRNHDGYANAGPYINQWGRNDFISSKVVLEKNTLYLMARAAEPLILSPQDQSWMNLLIRFPERDLEDWEGYHYRVIPENAGPGKAMLYHRQDGTWVEASEIPFSHGKDFVELAIPLGNGQPPKRVEFKWFDHMPEPLNPLDFQDHGDTAPNQRFRYTVVFSFE